MVKIPLLSSKSENSDDPTPIQVLAINKIDSHTSTIDIVEKSGAVRPMYNVVFHKKKPNIELYYSANATTIVGSISFHALSSKIEISLQDHSFAMTRKDLLA